MTPAIITVPALFLQKWRHPGRSTHLIIPFVLILHKMQKRKKRKRSLFYSPPSLLSFTGDCCSANSEAQGQDADESQSYWCVWTKAKWTFIQWKTEFRLTSPVSITQLQQFPEGSGALSSQFVPPRSTQAADWWRRGGLSQGPLRDHSRAVSHSPISIICAGNVCNIPRWWWWCVQDIETYKMQVGGLRGKQDERDMSTGMYVI